jgi:hypothetical protein
VALNPDELENIDAATLKRKYEQQLKADASGPAAMNTLERSEIDEVMEGLIDPGFIFVALSSLFLDIYSRFVYFSAYLSKTSKQIEKRERETHTHTHK